MAAQPEPCILVIFGASGDLTHRKLIPALYELSRVNGSAHGSLPERFAVIGVSRTPMSDDDFRDKMRRAVREHANGFDDDSWSRFAPCLYYHPGDAAKPDPYPGLPRRLAELGERLGINKANGMPNVLFYLSVAPDLYEPIIAQIGEAGLVTEGKRWCSINPSATAWQRIIVEKPFGTDLRSAHSLNM